MLLPDVFLNLVRVSHTMFHVLLVAPVVPDYEGCPTSTYQQFTRGTSVGLWASMEKRLTKKFEIRCEDISSSPCRPLSKGISQRTTLRTRDESYKVAFGL